MVTEPLRGARHVTVGAPRTRRAFAQCVQDLVEVHDPDAARIVLVMDQVHTHSPGSLSATFPPTEARRLAAKREIQHTPNHGSWRNMADLELRVRARQWLAQRLPDEPAMTEAVTAWAARRNAAIRTIAWQFTTADARITLRRRSPAFDV